MCNISSLAFMQKEIQFFMHYEKWLKNWQRVGSTALHTCCFCFSLIHDNHIERDRDTGGEQESVCVCLYAGSMTVHDPASSSPTGYRLEVAGYIDFYAVLDLRSNSRVHRLIHFYLSGHLKDLQPCWSGGCQLVTLTKGPLGGPQNPANPAKPSVASLLSKLFVIHPKSFHPCCRQRKVSCGEMAKVINEVLTQASSSITMDF